MFNKIRIADFEESNTGRNSFHAFGHKVLGATSGRGRFGTEGFLDVFAAVAAIHTRALATSPKLWSFLYRGNDILPLPLLWS